MLLRCWIAQVLRLPSRPSRRQRRASRQETLVNVRPRLEMLEERMLPAGPVLSPLAFTSFSLPANTTPSGQVALSGTLTDPNSPSSVNVTINWGDGNSSTVMATATSPGTFHFSTTTPHDYTNSSSSKNYPVFSMIATASDNRGASAPSTEAALVADGLQGSENITVGPGKKANLIQVTVGTFISSVSPPVNAGSIVVLGGESASTADTVAGNFASANFTGNLVLDNYTNVAVGNSISVIGALSGSTIVANAGTVVVGSINGLSVTTNSGSITAAGPGNITGLSVGTNTSTGTITGDSMSGSTIGTNSGTVTVSGNATNVTIGTLSATGSFTVVGTLVSLDTTTLAGFVSAGHIGSITAIDAPVAPTVFTLTDNNVTRSLVLAPASGSSLPPNGTVNYVYDHNQTSGDAELTMAVNEGSNYTGSYDVELLNSSAAPGSGLDLAALYNATSTPAHIRNVLLEGNLAPSAVDAGTIGISSSTGGIQLPGTALAGVGILGNAPAGSVQAASVQAVSFASITETTSSGPVTVLASTAAPTDAAQLLASGTAILQANNTFLAAAGQTTAEQSQPVALFLDTGTSGVFDPNDVLLGNQGFIDPVNPTTNPVLAQVAATGSSTTPSTIQTINLTGNGGSIQTAQVITSTITSSGDLGDLILQAAQGIEANVTAPSIFGNIAAPNGGISGTIQATSGNIGRVLTTNGSITGVTSIQTPYALSGTILSARDLISQVTVGSSFTSTGVIAAGGNLGYLDSSTLNRFGGVSVGSGFNGDAVAVGNIFGDISINGGLAGRIAAQGAPDVLGQGVYNGQSFARQGIVGNIAITGGLRTTAAVVSGGEVGDNGLNTGIFVNSGTIKGILAALGPISSVSTGQTKFASVFNDVGNPNSSQYANGANAAAIDNIFNGLTIDNLNIGQLATLLANLNNLHVGSNGNLSD